MEVLSEDELIIVHAYKLLVVDLKQRNIAGWCSTQGKQKVLCPVFSCGLVFLFFVFILASARNIMNGARVKELVLATPSVPNYKSFQESCRVKTFQV